MNNNDFITGLLVGLAIGLGTGLLWNRAYCLIRDGLQEKRDRNQSGFVSLAEIFRDVSKTGVMMVLLAAYLVGLGLFQVINYNKLNTFVDCQADYNQRSSLARNARADAGRTENQTLYAWLFLFAQFVTHPPPEGEEADPEDVREFTTSLNEAVEAHNERVRIEEQNPYPPEPNKFCGKPAPPRDNS